ncbi:putative adhesin [Burkholderia ubonensis]|uniref:putative adhesin n=1 Tax=Burkholderia ubonensis TaxID=101571 RepID=UPI0039F576A0
MIASFRNIIIKSAGSHAPNALLLSHGGYTPKRNVLQSGSGRVIIPEGVTMLFNSGEDAPSIGTKAIHLLRGYPIIPVDKKSPGAVIENYSLEYNELFDRCLPTEHFDLVIISQRGKAHMSDVFDGIRMHHINYSSIHSFACRVNKLTFSF